MEENGKTITNVCYERQIMFSQRDHQKKPAGSEHRIPLSHKPKGFPLKTFTINQTRPLILVQVTTVVFPALQLPYKNLYIFSYMDFRSKSLALPLDIAY